MRFLKAAITSIALTAALAQPAAAADDFSVSGAQTRDGYTINQSAEGHVVRRADGIATIWFRCGATALKASGTGVKQCYLEGANGLIHRAADDEALPGPTDAYVEVVDLPDQNYRICVQGSAQFLEGGYQFLADLTCSPW